MKDYVLARLDPVCRMLSECTTAPQAKKISDMARAAEVYARRQKLGKDAIQRAHMIVIDAQTLLGEFLLHSEKATGGEHGGRTKKDGSRRVPSNPTPTLDSAGINKKESSNAQFLASLKQSSPKAHEAVRSGGLSIAKAKKAAKKRKRLKEIEQAKKQQNPNKQQESVSVVLADPPWKYAFSETDSREVENQYPTMDTSEIEKSGPDTLPNAVLFLWATAPKLVEALGVMKAWGFDYKTHAVWDKVKIGMGYWFRGQHELLLVGTKGKFSPPLEDNRCSSIFSESRRKHSQKPECVYEWIEKNWPDKGKLEMYARKVRPGWSAIGNEV